LKDNQEQSHENDRHAQEREEYDDLMNSSHRVRQRKIKPMKTKLEPCVEQLSAQLTMNSDDNDDAVDGDDPDHDDNDNDDDRLNNIGAAKVIPVVADEYNSDSGISSLKTDFRKQHQHQYKKDSARSSDFGDDHSWAERITPMAHNLLMLKTFPGLRHTSAASSSIPMEPLLPPPPPPPPSAAPASEPNADLSRLMREKSKELEKQIEIFQKENTKLESLCQERNAAIKKLKQDRDEFERHKQTELDDFQKMKDEEIKRLKQEKRLFEQHRQQLREHPDKREREEIEILKKQVILFFF
jgi:hypothetical protein